MPSNDNNGLLAPLKPTRNLAEEVAMRIASQIRSGTMRPGDRLPTEAEMVKALGVSRTVVREAVAALRAENLVVTRQGAGVFVAEDTRRVPFRIDPDGLSSIADVVNVMELRLAIEVEAAVLAAERARARQRIGIERALAAFEAAVAAGESAVDEDFAFHSAIARATGNLQFERFLTFLGRHVIPRHSIRISIATPDEQARYLGEIKADHHRIAAAIFAHDPTRARSAMREHLSNSLERYRGLAARMRKSGRRRVHDTAT